MAEKSNKAGRIILAVLSGLILGAVINSLTIQLMVNIIPLPEGIDPNDPESLRAGMERFEFKHYISP